MIINYVHRLSPVMSRSIYDRIYRCILHFIIINCAHYLILDSRKPIWICTSCFIRYFSINHWGHSSSLVMRSPISVCIYSPKLQFHIYQLCTPFRPGHQKADLSLYLQLYIVFCQYLPCTPFKSSYLKADLNLHLLLSKILQYYSSYTPFKSNHQKADRSPYLSLYIAVHVYQLCTPFRSGHQKADLRLNLLLYKYYSSYTLFESGQQKVYLDLYYGFIRYFRIIHLAHRLGQVMRRPLYIVFHEYQPCSLFKSGHQKDDQSLHLPLYKVFWR